MFFTKQVRTAIVGVTIWPLLATAAKATAILTSALNPANGHTYYLIGDDPQAGKGISWTDAEAFAITLGGHLTTVRSAEENTWIQQTFPQYPFLWIGLSDQRSEGAYEWADGEPTSYLNWYSGEPNNYGGNEDFVEMYNFWGGGWNDNGNIAVDSSRWGFAAVAEVPEPSSICLAVLALLSLVLCAAAPPLPQPSSRP